VLIASVPHVAYSQEGSPGGTPTARAEDFLVRLRAATGTPGVSGAVASKGAIVFSSGAGFIDLENQVPATGVSVYNIGSVSKTITGIAVMQLLEQRRITLDDDIRAYVPEFPDKGAQITIRHLLTHTSGIRHYHATDFPGTPDNENILPIDSYLDGLRFFAQDPLLFPPGSYHFYSSYGVNLLQGVVEKASGMSFEHYMRERVWGPSGMTSAAFDIPDRVVLHRARSYRVDKGQVFNYYYNDLRYKYASGGMIASVEDLVKLGSAVNRDVLLRPETRIQMYTPWTTGLQDFREGAPPQTSTREQGMLWDLRRDSRGERVAYHCGSVRGSNACIVNFLDEDLVAAIATNSWECCGWSKADSLAAFFRAKK
jgi:CubicO group peptidase (beta-lactamase class C family)